MPWVEQTLVGYLSPGVALSLKAPVLPSKLLNTSSPAEGQRVPMALSVEVFQAEGGSEDRSFGEEDFDQEALMFVAQGF